MLTVKKQDRKKKNEFHVGRIDDNFCQRPKANSSESDTNHTTDHINVFSLITLDIVVSFININLCECLCLQGRVSFHQKKKKKWFVFVCVESRALLNSGPSMCAQKLLLTIMTKFTTNYQIYPWVFRHKHDLSVKSCMGCNDTSSLCTKCHCFVPKIFPTFN